MPELPEVETMVRGVRPALEGTRIRSATLSHTDVLRGVTRPKLLAALTGARIHRVFRRAKHGVLELEIRVPGAAATRRSATQGSRRAARGESATAGSPGILEAARRYFVLQPGMTGNLLIYDRPLTAGETRYAVLRARLEQGGEFVFRDVRRIGTLLLLDQRRWERYDRALGPEPLDPSLSAEQFAETLRHSRAAIKKVLMDQKKLVGVGNIYANEALFSAGIDPSKPADRVSPEGYLRLYLETRRILQAAIDAEGTTFRDYRTSTGEFGAFQLELNVYEREGEPCRVCGTRLAGTHDIDARITVFCWRCQG
jgi:formamidopyrimidine-DNA glycosylase